MEIESFETYASGYLPMPDGSFFINYANKFTT